MRAGACAARSARYVFPGRVDPAQQVGRLQVTVDQLALDPGQRGQRRQFLLAYGSERVVVTRHGKPLVALVSAADLARLEALDAQEAERDEQVVRAVSGVREVPASASRERQRFGIAAEHRRPGAG